MTISQLKNKRRSTDVILGYSELHASACVYKHSHNDIKYWPFQIIMLPQLRAPFRSPPYFLFFVLQFPFHLCAFVRLEYFRGFFEPKSKYGRYGRCNVFVDFLCPAIEEAMKLNDSYDYETLNIISFVVKIGYFAIVLPCAGYKIINSLCHQAPSQN